MKKTICHSTIYVFFLFLFGVTIAYADKGVFNAKVSPDETFTNTATSIKISAEVGSENLYISSVTAYQTTQDGKPIQPYRLNV